jgi:pyruvate dehydrogenase E2 component (dihydrolipoamide acetyltransferase)
MATPIEMPKLGNTVEDCLLARWNKRKGDRVAVGELVAEIETDKATFEVTAPVDGTVLEVFFDQGELVPVFSNICVIGDPGENAEPFRPTRAAQPAQAASGEQAAPRQPVASASQAPAPAPAEAFFSPRARRFAQEHGFHPGNITGSGPGGRVLEADLRQRYYKSPRTSFLARRLVEAGGEIRDEASGLNRMVRGRDLAPPPVRLSGVREKIARRMRDSLAATAQYTLHTSAEAAGLLALRARIKAARQRKPLPDINIGDMVMFCAVKALLQMPELNAELIDGSLYRHASVHIGFACDTPRGLLVPVVKDAHKLSLADLSERIKELATTAVEATIPADDLMGATFTVSNLGSFGIQSFTPLLNPPQVAILGVNTIELKPVRRDGKVEFEDHLGLSLTVDHQVIDGAPGARFLKLVREQIESIGQICDVQF